MGRRRRYGKVSRATNAAAIAYVKTWEQTTLELGDRVRLAMGTENVPRFAGSHRETNKRRRQDAVAIRALIGGNR